MSMNMKDLKGEDPSMDLLRETVERRGEPTVMYFKEDEHTAALIQDIDPDVWDNFLRSEKIAEAKASSDQYNWASIFSREDDDNLYTFFVHGFRGYTPESENGEMVQIVASPKENENRHLHICDLLESTLKEAYTVLDTVSMHKN